MTIIIMSALRKWLTKRGLEGFIQVAKPPTHPNAIEMARKLNIDMLAKSMVRRKPRLSSTRERHFDIFSRDASTTQEMPFRGDHNLDMGGGQQRPPRSLTSQMPFPILASGLEIQTRNGTYTYPEARGQGAARKPVAETKAAQPQE